MTRYEKLKRILIEQIQTCPIGTRLPPEREIAREHGLSRTTVNKVIVELERENYVRRQVGSGTYVVPRDSKIAYAGGPAEEIGRVIGEVVIIYPNFFADTIWEMVAEAELLAMRNNFTLTAIKLQPQTDYSTLVNLVKRSTQLIGILIIPSCDAFPEETLAQLIGLGKRVVFLDSVYEGPHFEGLFVVNGDQYKVGYVMLEELLRRGHRRIGYVANEPVATNQKRMLRGAKQALYDFKLRWKDVEKSKLHNISWHSPIDAGYEQTLQLVSAHPELTGLFYDTLPGAFAGLAALAKLGRRCPDDISVIAASGMHHCENYTVPAITTVNYPLSRLTDIGVEILLHPEKTFLFENIVNINLHERASLKEVTV